MPAPALVRQPTEPFLSWCPRAGPAWKPPRPGAVLRSMPFLRCLPRPQLKRLLAQGSFRGEAGPARLPCWGLLR